MSGTTYQRPSHRTVPGLSFARIARSELIKFRSLRSTWITYAVALVVGDGLGILAASLGGSEVSRHHEHVDPVALTLHGVMFAQLAVGVVGVMFVTGEYATGSIRASITAVPKRTPVLAAKALVLGIATAVVALALTLIAFFAGQAILDTWNLGVTLGHHGALRAVLASALYVVCVALMGLGIGFALRNTGGAIATLFGLVLVLPLLVQALPRSWQDHIDKFLPLNIANNLMSTDGHVGAHDLSNGWGIAMLVIYALVALGIGLTVLRRRDV